MRNRTGPVLVTVCIALGAVIATVSSLNLALPDLAQHTGATQTDLSWVVDAYALTFAALLLPAGALGDRYGRRRVLVIGLSVFALGAYSVLWLDTPAQIIGVRTVMGVAAAFIMPSTLSTITGTFEEKDRVKGVATWAGVAGASGILGLLVTGVLLERFDWKWVFFLTGAVALVALVLTLRFVPESADAPSAARDPLGAGLSAIGLFAVVYAIIEAPTNGWSSAETLTWLGAGLVVLAGFLLWELVPQRLMLDPRLFARPQFSAGVLSLTLQFFLFFGLIFVFLTYLQLVLGWSTLVTSVALMPVPLGVLPTARLAPYLSRRIGQAWLCGGGLLIVAVCAYVLSTFDRSTPYWAMVLVLWPAGVGMGLAMPPATTAIAESLPRAQQGVASAMNDLSRELGGALGIAVLGSVLNSTYRARIDLPAGVPPQVADAIRGSLPAALKIAERVPGPRGPMLAEHARGAFQAGMSDAMVVAALVVGVGAVLVMALLLLSGHSGPSRPASGPDRSEVPADDAARAEVPVGVGGAR